MNGERLFHARPRIAEGWKDGASVQLTASEDGASVYAYLLQRPPDLITLRSVRATAGGGKSCSSATTSP